MEVINQRIGMKKYIVMKIFRHLFVFCIALAFSSFLFGATTISYTGSSTTYTVPAGVNSITLEAYGAAGGYSDDGSTGNTRPGYGARMRGTFIVTPGQVLKVLVGGQGRPVADNPVKLISG